MRRRLLLAAAVGALAAAGAPAARAHALLVSSQPQDGAVVTRAPHQVQLQFSEKISDRFRLVRVSDGSGRIVNRVRARSSGRLLVLDLPSLHRGTYEIDWTVLAEDDGHLSGGALVFGVGKRAPAAVGANKPGAAPPAELALRWIDFSLQAFLLGTLVVSLLLAHVAAAAGLRRRVLVAGAGSGGLALALGAVLLVRQAHALLPTLPRGSSLPDAVLHLLGAHWGALWLAREALLAGLVVAALLPRRRWAAAGALAAALAVTRALGSHAAAGGVVSVAAAALHILAAAVWIGGLLAFAFALRSSDAPAALARACRRPIAVGASFTVAVVLATGLYEAAGQVASVDALVTTSYGQTLLVKTALVLAAGALGLANATRFRSLSLGAEAVVGIGIFLAAAVLTASVPARGPQFAPPRAADPAALTARVADLLLTVSVRPNRPGTNIFTAVAISSRRPPPAPIDGVSLRLPGSRTIDLRQVGPGRYLAAARLDRQGRLEATAVVRRGRRTLAAGLAWTVAAPDPAGPVVVSARPLAPLLRAAAMLLLLAAAVAALRLVVVPRLRRPVPT